MGAEVTLDQINVVVSDMPTTAEFLEALGISVSDTLPEWMEHHRQIQSAAAGLDVDLDSAAFASYWGGLPPGWTGVIVTLRAPNRLAVDELFARAVAGGATALRAPYDAFWGARAAFVEAPGGVVLGLMSAAEDEYRADPPDPSGFLERAREHPNL
jgi:uncharacterized glyoxalase superfamily protein PhnB